MRSNFNPKIALLADNRKERLTRVADLYVTGRFTMKEMAGHLFVGEPNIQASEKPLQ